MKTPSGARGLAGVIWLALAGFAATAVCAGLRTVPVAPTGVILDGVGVLIVRDGARGAWLRARIGAAIEQRLDACVVRTTRDELAVGCGEPARAVARRSSSGWTGSPLGADDAAAIARVIALDAAYAVQGTSLVFGATAYEPCTLRCTQARRCGEALARCSGAACSEALARGAADVVTCAACLERAP